MVSVMQGIRVVEVASWTFVPAAGAVLADWGADVVKVENTGGGDPQRGLASSGLIPTGPDGVDVMVEIPNRGKRSIGLDLATPRGREVLLGLVAASDVFLTNLLPASRRTLRIDVDDVREANPAVVYVRGSGQGPAGPDGGRGGFDGSSYWARAGVARALTPDVDGRPLGQTAAFGDLQGAMNLVAGISAALLHRERTGRAPVVDVSLLATGMWVNGPAVVASSHSDVEAHTGRDHADRPNPLVGDYRTADGRYLALIMLESDRFWADLCHRIGRPELAEDPRFADSAARDRNRWACVAELDATFGSAPLAHWRAALDGSRGVWAVHQGAREVLDDEQALANGYVARSVDAAGRPFPLVAPPVQFDTTPARPGRAPIHGEHTEEVLLELGYGWPEISALKEEGAVL